MITIHFSDRDENGESLTAPGFGTGDFISRR